MKRSTLTVVSISAVLMIPVLHQTDPVHAGDTRVKVVPVAMNSGLITTITASVGAEVVDEDESDLDEWAMTHLGEEPEAIPGDASLRIPLQWDPIVGLVKRG